MRFVAQPRRARSRCVAAGVRSCQGVEALPPSPCGLRATPPASPLATGPPPACPHWALPLCLAALVLGAVIHLGDCVWSGHDWRCVIAPRRLAHSFTHSFTRDVHATNCLDLLVVCRFPTSRATDVRPFIPARFEFGSVTRFQRCICTTVMRTFAQRTHFACRYRYACVHCLHACLVCATMSFRPLMPPGASGRTRTHALHAHIIVYTFYPRAWSLRAAGLALDQPFWLDVW